MLERVIECINRIELNVIFYRGPQHNNPMVPTVCMAQWIAVSTSPAYMHVDTGDLAYSNMEKSPR